MDLMNLIVQRVILHEVYKRSNDRNRIEPQYGTALEHLNAQASDALRDRIVAAMSKSDRCIEMTIRDTAPGSMASVADLLVDSDDELFVASSRQVADLLADAQKVRTIPGGVLVVFSGTFGVPVRRIVGVIKAEVHSGFQRDTTGGRSILKFLESLILTPQTKLYKIGLFVEQDPAANELDRSWRAFIYDESMTPRDRYGAAQYFYEGFLGLAFPDSSARHTKQFHDWTKDFIREMNVGEEDKVALHNALVTYLKVDQSPTVEVNAFGTAYFGEPEVRDSYETYMRRKGFPDNAVYKDLTDVQASLRVRRFVFRNNVRLSAPAEGFENKVLIEVVDGDATAPTWTRVTIKDRIASQE